MNILMHPAWQCHHHSARMHPPRTEGDVRDPLALSWPDISRWPYFPLKPLASPHSVMRYRAAVDARISFCLDVMLELFAMLVVYLYID